MGRRAPRSPPSPNQALERTDSLDETRATSFCIAVVLAQCSAMIILSIQYVIDPNKLAHFAEYARNWPEPIRRCGGDLIGYFLPTKLAGRTNVALALIGFESLAAYEKYRLALGQDPDAVANVTRANKSGCILVEDRSFLTRA